MRVLIFSLAYYPQFVGGAEVAVKEITDRIESGEIQFDMITCGGVNSFEKIGNVGVYRVLRGKLKPGIFRKFLYIGFAYFKAVSLQRKNKYDATWAIMASYGGSAAVPFKWTFPRVRFLQTIQEGENFGRREGGIFRPFFKLIFKTADRIQSISNFLADWSRSMGATCPIEVIPNGVDFESFSRPIDLQRRKEIRQPCGFSDQDFVIVTASRLVMKNAVDNLISSLKELDSNCKALILGTGPDEADLKSLAEKLGLKDRVVFKGFVEHKDLLQYLQSSDVFVRASRTEGLGNSFLEAMAAGIPVVATPVGGIPDFLKDGENGLFCEVDNPKSIAQKVNKLMRDKESRDYLVRNGKETVRSRYDWKTVASEMKKFLLQ